MAALPFISPSESNFIYDPFGVEVEVNKDDNDGNLLSQSGLLNFSGSLKGSEQGNLNFDKFIMCLKNMSYSSLFTQENSKKFHFKTIAQQMRDNNISEDATQNAPHFAGRSMTN